MKPTKNTFRFLTPAIVAAVLALPAAGGAAQESGREPHAIPAGYETPGDASAKGPIADPSASSLGQGWLQDAESRAGAAYGSGPVTMPVKDVIKASDLIGKSVKDHAGTDLAEVHDLVVDLETGRVLAAILASGGIAGVGTDYYAVPPASLKRYGTRDHTTDAALMKASGKFDMAAWRQALTPVALASIYSAHAVTFDLGTHGDAWAGHRSHPVREPEGDLDSDRAPVRDAIREEFIVDPDLPAPENLRIETERADRDPRAVDQGPEFDDLQARPVKPDLTSPTTEGDVPPRAEPQGEARSRSASRDNWGPPIREDATAIEPSAEGQSRTYVPASAFSGLGGMALASEILGSEVIHTSGEELGKVKDLGIDLSHGRVVTAIVSSGGWLGLGGDLRAIPPMLLQAGYGEDKTIRYEADLAKFEALPAFGTRSWPVHNQTYVDRLYRDFGVQP